MFLFLFSKDVTLLPQSVFLAIGLHLLFVHPPYHHTLKGQITAVNTGLMWCGCSHQGFYSICFTCPQCFSHGATLGVLLSLVYDYLPPTALSLCFTPRFLVTMSNCEAD